MIVNVKIRDRRGYEARSWCAYTHKYVDQRQHLFAVGIVSSREFVLSCQVRRYDSCREGSAICQVWTWRTTTDEAMCRMSFMTDN